MASRTSPETVLKEALRISQGVREPLLHVFTQDRIVPGERVYTAQVPPALVKPFTVSLLERFLTVFQGEDESARAVVVAATEVMSRNTRRLKGRTFGSGLLEIYNEEEFYANPVETLVSKGITHSTRGLFVLVNPYDSYLAQELEATYPHVTIIFIEKAQLERTYKEPLSLGPVMQKALEFSTVNGSFPAEVSFAQRLFTLYFQHELEEGKQYLTLGQIGELFGLGPDSESKIRYWLKLCSISPTRSIPAEIANSANTARWNRVTANARTAIEEATGMTLQEALAIPTEGLVQMMPSGISSDTINRIKREEGVTVTDEDDLYQQKTLRRQHKDSAKRALSQKVNWVLSHRQTRFTDEEAQLLREYFQQGLQRRQIVQKHNMPPRTINNRLHRLVAKVRELAEPRDQALQTIRDTIYTFAVKNEEISRQVMLAIKLFGSKNFIHNLTRKENIDITTFATYCAAIISAQAELGNTLPKNHRVGFIAMGQLFMPYLLQAGLFKEKQVLEYAMNQYKDKTN